MCMILDITEAVKFFFELRASERKASLYTFYSQTILREALLYYLCGEEVMKQRMK